MNKAAVKQCLWLMDFFCGCLPADVASSNRSPVTSPVLTGSGSAHVSSCCREGENPRITLPLKTILEQIKCCYAGFMSVGARAKHLQGSVSCGFSAPLSQDGENSRQGWINLIRPRYSFGPAAARLAWRLISGPEALQ